MKTWEVEKELLKNPKKKFKRLQDGNIYLLNDCNIISRQNYGCFLAISINEDWEEVIESVTWQEAIEAWAFNRKGFKIVLPNGKEFIQNSCFKLGLTSGTNFNELGLRSDHFQNGKWYII